MNALRDQVGNQISNAFTGFDDMIQNSSTVLGHGLDSFDQAVTLSNTIANPFCDILIAICILIEIAQVASKVDVIKWEHGLKLLVKMVFAKLCINIVPHLLLACYLQAGKWIDDLGNMTIGSDVMNLGSTANDQISGLLTKVKSFWAIIGLFLSVFIVVLAIKICGLVVSVMAFGRMFELYVYVVISPLPCAFLPLGNGDGTGFSHLTAKFFRGFGAVCLQGVMMLICLKIFGLLMSAAVNTAIQAGVKATEAANAPASAYTVAVGDLCFALLLACIVLVMSLVKCGGWAKSVLDVG